MNLKTARMCIKILVRYALAYNFLLYQRIPKHLGFALAYHFPFLPMHIKAPRMHTNEYQISPDVFIIFDSYQRIPDFLRHVFSYLYQRTPGL